MTEALQQFHFLRVWWLAALALLPLLWWLGMRPRSAQRELSRLVDADLLPHLLRGRKSSRAMPTVLAVIGWTLCFVALAGPTWNKVTQPLYASRATQVVAISLSQHMLARDVAPSRLDRARYKAHALLASNRDGLNALIGYAGEAFVVAPLTADADSLADLLDAMAPDTMPLDGDNAALAIDRGAALIHDAKASKGSLVLITDQTDAAAIDAARKAQASGVQVSVLGVGTVQGGPVPSPDGGFLHDAQDHVVLARRDDAALASLAAAGGGRYIVMTADGRDIDALHAQLQSGPAMAVQGQTGDAWQDRGPWLLVPLLLIAATAFRRGWLLLLPLLVLPLFPRNAMADGWQNLWQRPDQRAAQALRRGDSKQAMQFAQTPAWRGAAAYRAGDFATAAQALQRVDGSDGAYNLGNALARQGRYAEAIEAYDRALKRAPANADAVANRKAVEDWLKRQPKQSPKQDKKKSQGDSGGKGSSSADGQGQDGQSGTQQPPQKKPAQGAGDAGSKDGQTTPSPSPSQDAHDPSGQGKTSDQPKPLTPQQQAAQDAQTRQAQTALQQQMDKALAAGKRDKPAEHQLGAASADKPDSKLPADLQHALQRVPDDPGALLRRKFQLEYLRRHGGVPDDEEQP